MRYGLLSLIVVAAACSLAGSELAMSQTGVRNFVAGDCVRPLSETPTPDQATLESVASWCEAAGNRERGVRAARARFYSGRAYRGTNNIDAAVRQLRSALDTGHAFENQPNSRDDFTREARAARFELVRAYITQDGQSLNLADELLSEFPPRDVGIPYFNARISLARSPQDGKIDAFNQLKRVFTRPDLIENPACRRDCGDLFQRLDAATVQEGRDALFNIGIELGKNQLTPRTETPAQRADRLVQAVEYFRAAKDVVEVACPAPANDIGGARACGPGSADAFYRFGVAQLEAAGVPEDGAMDFSGTLDAPGGLDCLGGTRTASDDGRILEAGAAFDAMRRGWSDAALRARAYWGRGCATLARLGAVRYAPEQQTMLGQAISDLNSAIGNPSPTDPLVVTPQNAPTIVALASAHAMRGSRVEAQRYFQAAITGGNLNSSLRARIHVERARTFYVPRDPNTPIAQTGTDIYMRAVTEVNNATDDTALRNAISDLDAALRIEQRNASATDAQDEAAVIRAHIHLRLPNYTAVGPLLAPLTDPSRRNTTASAPAAYLLSRCLTLTQQNWLLNPSYPNGAARCGNLGRLRGNQIPKDLATLAYYSDPRNGAYRHQACLTRIVFSTGVVTDDDQYCAADPDRGTDRHAEALYYEGMFWLRRALMQFQEQRFQSWSHALQNFRNAAALLEVSGDRPMEWPVLDVSVANAGERATLLELVTYGQRYIQSAVRLEDRQCAGDNVKNAFRRLGIPISAQCN